MQDVGVLGELEHGQTVLGFLQLAVRGRADAPVRDSGGKYGGIHRQGRVYGIFHLLCCLDGDHLHTFRRRHVRRAGDKHHLRPQPHQRACQRRALRPAGPVGDVAYGVNRLMRGAGGDKDSAAFQRAVSQRRLNRCHDLHRLGHAAGAVFAAGHVAPVRTSDQNTVAAQGRQIALGRCVIPHAHVHRGHDHHRRVSGQQEGRGQIIGQAACHLGHQIGCGRSHDHQIGHAAELDMPHLGLVTQIEQITVDLVARQCRDRQRRYEFLTRAG